MTSERFLPFLDVWRSILWPDFAEHDGCVFRAKLDAKGEQVYRDWMALTCSRKTEPLRIRGKTGWLVLEKGPEDERQAV